MCPYAATKYTYFYSVMDKEVFRYRKQNNSCVRVSIFFNTAYIWKRGSSDCPCVNCLPKNYFLNVFLDKAIERSVYPAPGSSVLLLLVPRLGPCYPASSKSPRIEAGFHLQWQIQFFCKNTTAVSTMLSKCRSRLTFRTQTFQPSSLSL